MNVFRPLIGVLSVVAVLATYPLEPRENKDDLTLEWAEFRRAQVKSVAYDLQFTLVEDAETFEGAATLQVELNQTDAALSIDLKAKTIHSVAVDGETVQGLIERDGSFDIPASYLTPEPMAITVEYTGMYSNTRDGLCHYKDPVDGREYLFTNLEPYAAHHVFPCFDQPDIKATYTSTVTAPAGWTAIGNCLPQRTSAQGDTTTTHFRTTPVLSTYLFFLGGGEYRIWRDDHNGLPLTLYARESLAEYFDADRLFAETKSGLDFFNDYFGTPYPFDQYGHVFAPELGPGAMENPGAVTMNEYMIFRGAPTEANYRSRNNTLLHEMAHMWFGNLVTMAWWNDLWLNESFATFSSYQAQAALGEYTGIWERFSQTKAWAYNQDQLSTTHPVEVPVPAAQLAIANFDGITYAKGASAMKQLWFKVGAGAYQRGVTDYFKNYAWKNATREQFIASIAAHTDHELDNWTQRWIQTAGLNSISVECACREGRIADAYINQAPVNAPVLSPHRTQLGLFKFDEFGKLVPYAKVPVSYAEAREPIAQLEGQPCPDFLYPNHEDMDYGLFFLDDRSFETASKHLDALEDPFTRRLVWGTLYSMVRHQKLRASVLMEMLLGQLPKESDPGMLEYLLGNRPTLDVFQIFLKLEASLAVAPRLNTLLWQGYQAAAPGSDARLHWLDAYVTAAARPEELGRLRSLLEQGVESPQLDQPRRWQVIRKLAALGASGIDALVEAELEQDPTDQGTRYAFGIRGAIPTLEAKRAQWERMKDPDLSLSLLRSGVWTFHNRLYPELSEAFVDDWFDYIASRDWDAEQHRISSWFGGLMPPVYTQRFLARSEAAMAAATLPERARRAWQESNDAIRRVIAIREYDSAGANGPAALSSNPGA